MFDLLEAQKKETGDAEDQHYADGWKKDYFMPLTIPLEFTHSPATLTSQ